jgi:pimeloyl-ACP methyl ester carboxylesterase
MTAPAHARRKRPDGCGRLVRHLRTCLAAAMTAIALAPPAAMAQALITLVPAQEQAALRGPTRAEGVVIWSHGRSIDVEDSLAPTPEYITEMRKAGWDTFRLNRLRAGDTLPASGAALASYAEQFKASGYHRVVLAGQSFGAFISLIAAGRSSAVDAVIGTAPAAYGNFADNYDTFRLNATKLYELLENVRHARVALAFFHGDEFDPGGRGERSLEILGQRDLPSLVIDQPARLVSHWAASTHAFTTRFGDCLASFAAMDEAHGALSCDNLLTPKRVAGLP